ncbi:Lrp/AsnC family transcriptional regulator [Asanoa sp. NPDC049573]|uniref:Lrp/AsnC family transcriptional regulator n=1 Tax=Asanoa sp. NPDC049573 TaxID=3155396 RepID=UPI00343B4E66
MLSAPPGIPLRSGGTATSTADDSAGRTVPTPTPTAALARDGRLGYPELAAATGWGETTVRRRLQDLTASGALFYDVDVDPDVLGFRARVLLWLSVAPSRLAAVGAALAASRRLRWSATSNSPARSPPHHPPAASAPNSTTHRPPDPAASR